MASRPVRFCGVCGHRVPVTSRTYGLRVAYCRLHDDVPALDAEATHDLPSSAVTARSPSTCPGCDGTGLWRGGTTCTVCRGRGQVWPLDPRGPSAPRERGR